MKQNILLTSLAFIFLIVWPPASKAQVFSRKKAKTGEHPPKAILVQLNTNQRKKQYFTRTKSDKLLKQINTDTDSMIAKIVMDFTDNFTYCPVYYYIDTNASLVKQQKFKGVLLDSNLHPASDIVIKPSDTYFIALLGVPPVPQQTADDKSGNSYTTALSTAKTKKGLVVLDKDMMPLRKPEPSGAVNIFTNANNKKQMYKYTSPRFDIQYRPVAAKYSEKLADFYGPYPYK